MRFRSTLIAGITILVMNTTAGSAAGVGSVAQELTPKMPSMASVGILHQIAERRKLKKRQTHLPTGVAAVSRTPVQVVTRRASTS
ncbi:MAG: hypothetical protein ACI89J_001947 [Hyphomicrobiaceae bacterium]|jgi:hypothetical protein